MKAYIVAVLLVSTVLRSFTDAGQFSSTDDGADFIGINDSECGPKTFSANVRAAFQKESNLDQYSPSHVLHFL